jgi:type II secretory pathway component GspD/PulD (secretin)
VARATDASPDLLDETRQKRKVLFDMLRARGLDAQRDAAEKFRTGQTEVALEVLQEYLNEVLDAQLEVGQVTSLRRPVESRLAHFRLLKEQKDLADGRTERSRAAVNEVALTRKAEELKRKNVEKLMKEFNALYREGKFPEAESVAMRAQELDPDNPVLGAAVNMARMNKRRRDYNKLKDNREANVVEMLNDAENENNAGEVTRTGISLDPDALARSRKRGSPSPIKVGPRQSDMEKEIERRLSSPVSLNFHEAPLSQVLNDLRDFNAINIVVDQPALQEEGVSLETPISMKLDRVSLKSALNLLLHQVHLTYVIKDDVLQITSESQARGKLVTMTYQVADLVIPVQDFGDIRTPLNPPPLSPQGIKPPQALPTPVYQRFTLPAGTPTGTPMGSALDAPPAGPTASPFGGGVSGNNGTWTKHGPSNTMEEVLIKLITSTVQPRSWGEMGGPGTIDYFPLSMALVINQTPDIQEQIQDLLAALRRLQDQEVAVEVRYIVVTEDFFERIGVNFQLDVRNDNASAKFQPALDTNNFAPIPFINAFAPRNFLTGITPAGTLTNQLDIPITNNTYATAVPPFGGYPLVPGYGGTTLGLAFLSEIQVFLFMEAVQGDSRNNVMQAPKLTLFNGQTANITINEQRLFVTEATATVQQGLVLFAPQPQPSPINSTTMQVQAVISADRRFVRLSITPQIQALTIQEVPLFPIVVPLFNSFDGQANSGQPVVFTQFLQQPQISTIQLQTTVVVPDGGTVLMGGLKRLSEGRIELGPPILSKIPYVNRLFKNVGYGRETASLMIMVTPRIIIQEEEEERATGSRREAAVAP